MANQNKAPEKAKAPTKAKAPAKAKETKADLFIRLGTLRVEKVLNSLRILGNCSNKGNYQYTPEQVETIKNTLTKALDNTLAKFQAVKKEPEKFKF